MDFATIKAPWPLESHAACRLADGRVCIRSGSRRLAIFDPESGTWTVCRTPPDDLVGPLTTLADGRVFSVLTQPPDGPLARNAYGASIWDPADDTWWVGDESELCVTGQWTASLLPDRRILIVGGYVGEDAPSGETHIYDVERDRWRRGPRLRHPRRRHYAVALPDGDVLVHGGEDLSPHGVVRRGEVFSASTGRWRSAGVLDDARSGACVGDKVVFYSGAIWDPRSRRSRAHEEGYWNAHHVVQRPDGRVYALGAERVEQYVDGDGWISVGRLAGGVPEGASVTGLLDGRLLVLGGVLSWAETVTYRDTGVLLTPPTLDADPEPVIDPRVERVLDALAPELDLVDGVSLEKLAPLVLSAIADGADPRRQASLVFRALSASGDLVSAYRGREWTIWRALRG